MGASTRQAPDATRASGGLTRYDHRADEGGRRIPQSSLDRGRVLWRRPGRIRGVRTDGRRDVAIVMHDEETAAVLDLRTAAPIGVPVRCGERAGQLRVLFTRQGVWLAGAIGTEIPLWEMSTGTSIGAPLSGHTGWIASIGSVPAQAAGTRPWSRAGTTCASVAGTCRVSNRWGHPVGGMREDFTRTRTGWARFWVCRCTGDRLQCPAAATYACVGGTCGRGIRRKTVSGHSLVTCTGRSPRGASPD